MKYLVLVSFHFGNSDVSCVFFDDFNFSSFFKSDVKSFILV